MKESSHSLVRRHACKIASLHFPGTNDDEQFSSPTDMNTVRSLALYTRYQNTLYKVFSIKEKFTIILYILLSLFCTVCTILNVVNTDISLLPYTKENLWKVGFAFARPKPLCAVMARSYRRTCFIVDTCVLTLFATEYPHLRLIISCKPPFGTNKLHVLSTRSAQWKFNL
jgi:hypothetical protein